MRALACLVVAVLGAPAWAAPFAVRLGEARLVLDAPPGFADTLDLASPRLQELAESLTSASNRILLFALTDADLRRFRQGEPPEFRRYLLVATPRALERESIGLSQFRAFAADAVRGLGDPVEPADLRAFLEAQPVGRPVLLRELRRTPVAVSLLVGARMPPRTERDPQYLAFVTTFMLIRGKALSVSTYASYRSAEDTDWLIEAARRWAEELQRLNGR